MYAVYDEFGNQITTGLESFDAAKQAARRYLAAHKDAPCVEIYDDQTRRGRLLRRRVNSDDD